MPELKLYNSLTRQKEVFQPLDPNHVKVYACGPTVYSYAHIGNARMAVVFDLLARVLKTLYPKVTYVSNITDVDDKIMAAAKETGEAINTITEKYTRIYNDDMAALGAAAPDVQPKATEHIGEMIALIEKLIAADHAYEKEGHVMFNVPSFPAYGGLSGRSRDDQIAGARVEIAPYKKDPADFILWKPSSEDQPGWDSPWGRGRPGWHIECSAMAEKHLGLPFDIHGGGADLKFPHHENEIAQSCCAHGSENDLSGFAKYWVHNGFVTVEGEKMSKSLGNFITVHQLIEQTSLFKGIVRVTLMGAHYRQPLDWTSQAYHQASVLWGRIDAVLNSLSNIQAEKTKEIYGPVYEALLDDLNTPLAFSKLNELIKDINKSSAEHHPYLKSILQNTLDILGIQSGKQAMDEINTVHIEKLLQERDAAKKDKNFKRADEIRDQLTAQGIVIEDTPQGAKWRKA